MKKGRNWPTGRRRDSAALHTLWLGGLYLYQDPGRYAEAIEQAERALELQPGNPMAAMSQDPNNRSTYRVRRISSK